MDESTKSTIERAFSDGRSDRPPIRKVETGKVEVTKPNPLSTTGRSQRLGEMLIERGLLKEEQLSQVLAYQQTHSVSFGVAAKQLGFLSDDQLNDALADQFGYPHISKSDTKVSTELVAAFEPNGEFAESLRSLRSDLIAVLPRNKKSAATLAVLSPRHGDGRTHLLANLGIVFAQLGKQVLLVDGDLRKPRLHEMFKLSNDCGVSVMLSGRDCSTDARLLPAFPGLHVLSAGPTPPNPQELVSSDRMTSMLHSVSRSYDFVLIDTPAAAHFADAENLAEKADATLIIARRNKTETRAVLDLARRLRKKNITVAGCVLVA